MNKRDIFRIKTKDIFFIVGYVLKNKCKRAIIFLFIKAEIAQLHQKGVKKYAIH